MKAGLKDDPGQDKEWARGKIHTNSIEGFWSLLKRGIRGVYHSVSEKYVQDYINEYGFRHNHRKDEKPMFLTILRTSYFAQFLGSKSRVLQTTVPPVPSLTCYTLITAFPFLVKLNVLNASASAS